MKIYGLIFILCFKLSHILAKLTTGPGTTIDDSVRIVGNVSVGDNFSVSYNTQLENSTIGNNVEIHHGSVIGNSVEITDFATVQATLGNGCFLNVHAKVLGGCVVGDNVVILGHSTVEAKSVGSHSVIGAYSDIKKGSELKTNVHIGQHSTIGENAKLGANVVVVGHVYIENGAVLNDYDFVIRSPSSDDLYELAGPYGHLYEAELFLHFHSRFHSNQPFFLNFNFYFIIFTALELYPSNQV